MSFHEGKETLEEYRYESNQFHKCPRLCRRTSNELFLIDSRITKINENDNEEENSNILSRLFHSLNDSTELINERLILVEHSDPVRLIENLISNGEYGEALRVCKVFNRTDLADQIHERELRLSSSQLGAHLIRIQSRLHVLQLCTTVLYPTFDEQHELIQIGLDQATRKQLFNNLFYSDQPFFQSIYDENLYLKDIQEKQIPLNIPQKQILLYRRKLLDEKRKLYLYDDMMKICKIFQQYQSNIFDKFREWDYKQIALRCARVSFLQIPSEPKKNSRTWKQYSGWHVFGFPTNFLLFRKSPEKSRDIPFGILLPCSNDSRLRTCGSFQTRAQNLKSSPGPYLILTQTWSRLRFKPRYRKAEGKVEYFLSYFSKFLSSL